MTQIRAVCNWAVALGVIRGVNAGKSHRNLFRRHILRLLKHPVLFFSAILTLICINLNNEPNACLYFICIYYYCLLFEPFSVKNARQFWTYTSIRLRLQPIQADLLRITLLCLIFPVWISCWVQAKSSVQLKTQKW